jgi:hypothetical protein
MPSCHPLDQSHLNTTTHHFQQQIQPNPPPKKACAKTTVIPRSLAPDWGSEEVTLLPAIRKDAGPGAYAALHVLVTAMDFDLTRWVGVWWIEQQAQSGVGGGGGKANRGGGGGVCVSGGSVL